MRPPTPLWIATREGQDWRDEHVLSAIEWMRAGVPEQAWRSRMDRVEANFERAKADWAVGRQSPLFDPNDAVAWYVFQANAYACNRRDCFEPEAFRIAPVFRRLGQVLPDLRTVVGADERAARLLTDGRKQPDDGLFELLVAAAYKKGGWPTVTFVPEQRGGAKTHDLDVSKPRRRWAVECKRVNRSGYEAEEKSRGDALAAPVHELCRRSGRSISVEVVFRKELTAAPADYLSSHIAAYLRNPAKARWTDEVAAGQISDVDWELMRQVLRHDDIFYASSRMIELLVGYYAAHADHSVAASWRPSPVMPLHATAITQASVVSWVSASREAAHRKARHFRSIVARAARQLPGDRPGVVHVGYETRDGNSVDELRHLLNRLEVSSFEPGDSRLRWVYGNYLSPEHTTARMEASAISETTATYPIGRMRAGDPLPSHLLFSDEPGRFGAHW